MMEDKQISEFNESMLQIQRLHNHWLDFDKFIKRGDFSSARWELDSIEGELFWDAKRIDRDDDETGYVKQLFVINKTIKISFFKIHPVKVYNLLREKERLLREIQQESGKGARYKSEDEDTLV